MPRRCSCCVHKRRDAIDHAIVGGDAYSGIARRFAVGADAVERHAAAHVSKAIAKARNVRDVAHGASLIGEIIAIRDRAAELGRQAEENGDLRTALMAVRELTRNTELVARLSLEAQAGTAHDITAHPVWHEVAAEIMSVLARHPEARREVMEMIREKLGVGGIVLNVDPSDANGATS